MIVGLWILSVLGSCLNFLTLFYVGKWIADFQYFLNWVFSLSNLHFFTPKTGFLLLHSVPVLYEKYEDKVDAFAEKAEAELKKQYAMFNSQVLSKIPRGPLKDKKFL